MEYIPHWHYNVFLQGSVFLTFRTVEACNEYVAAESKKYKDTELESR